MMRSLLKVLFLYSLLAVYNPQLPPCGCFPDVSSPCEEDPLIEL